MSIYISTVYVFRITPLRAGGKTVAVVMAVDEPA